MFFTLQGAAGAARPLEISWTCAVLPAPENGRVEEPGLQFQFQCGGLELGTLPSGRPESLKALGVLANGVGVTW